MNHTLKKSLAITITGVIAFSGISNTFAATSSTTVSNKANNAKVLKLAKLNTNLNKYIIKDLDKEIAKIPDSQAKSNFSTDSSYITFANN
jgi:hypothetical protein